MDTTKDTFDQVRVQLKSDIEHIIYKHSTHIILLNNNKHENTNDIFKSNPTHKFDNPSKSINPLIQQNIISCQTHKSANSSKFIIWS